MGLDFTYFMPTRVYFGAGRLRELSMAGLPGGKALVATGHSAGRHGNLSRVLGLLEENGVSSRVFDGIERTAPAGQVDDAAAVARAKGCDFVLALGGGGVIGAAKCIALMARNEGRYWDYVPFGSGGAKLAMERPLPLVAVPTVSGAGAESSPWSVISKEETAEKAMWGMESTFPVLSVVDPELCLTVPPEITALSAMDTFFHAVECFVSTADQPASDYLALEAASLVKNMLPAVLEDGGNLEARTRLAWAAAEGGICQSLSSCISLHSLAFSVQALFPSIPHGAALVMLSVPYFTYLAGNNPRRLPSVARAMGEDVDGLSEAEKPYSFITALKKLIRDAGMDGLRLSDHGVQEEDAPRIASHSLSAMRMLYDVTPVNMTEQDARAIILQSLR